jgi:hypothetical protein
MSTLVMFCVLICVAFGLRERWMGWCCLACGMLPDLLRVLDPTMAELSRSGRVSHWVIWGLLLPGLLALLLRKRYSAVQVCAAGWAGFAFHYALESLTWVGWRPWPYSAFRISVGLLPWLDVWLLAGLVAALFTMLLRHLVSGELGVTLRSQRLVAVIALVGCLLWVGFRWVQRGSVEARLASKVFGGVNPLRTGVFPENVSPFQWTALVETPRFFLVMPADARMELSEEAGQKHYKSGLGDSLLVAKQAESVRLLEAQGRWLVWRIFPPQGQQVWEIQLSELSPILGQSAAEANIQLDMSFRLQVDELMEIEMPNTTFWLEEIVP